MNQSDVLKQYFGYSSFLPGQNEIIDSILSGRDALALMPTGAGKSVCYQVPALMLPGITLVISPLISLMQDQVKALNAAGIHAAYINSSLTEGQISKALMLAAKGTYKIIYVAPERLETYGFRRFVTSVNISMIAVDEAHCISQWGQDFRPSYMKITEFVDSLAYRPVISAFTATATPEVQNDILDALRLHDPKIVVTGFDRPNLFFKVEANVKKKAYLLNYISSHKDQSGIIYCATRKNVDQLYEICVRAGIRAGRYHAGMDSAQRMQTQEDFIYDRLNVIIATNAFGMGIDKSDVRYVIHYNMPQSMENYYQEAGRAGRDGNPAECILLYSAADIMIVRTLLENKDYTAVDEQDIPLLAARDEERLQAMIRYCQTRNCLRHAILTYFGEVSDESCGNCGNCCDLYETLDMTKQALSILRCVRDSRGRFGMSVIANAVTGSKSSRMHSIGADTWPSYGLLKNEKEAVVKILMTQMIQDGILRQSHDRYSLVWLGEHAGELENGSRRVSVYVPVKKKPEKKTVRIGHIKSKEPGLDQASEKDENLFEKLRELRLKIARSAGLPPYIVIDSRNL